MPLAISLDGKLAQKRQDRVVRLGAREAHEVTPAVQGDVEMDPCVLGDAIVELYHGARGVDTVRERHHGAQVAAGCDVGHAQAATAALRAAGDSLDRHITRGPGRLPGTPLTLEALHKTWVRVGRQDRQGALRARWFWKGRGRCAARQQPLWRVTVLVSDARASDHNLVHLRPKGKEAPIQRLAILVGEHFHVVKEALDRSPTRRILM